LSLLAEAAEREPLLSLICRVFLVGAPVNVRVKLLKSAKSCSDGCVGFGRGLQRLLLPPATVEGGFRVRNGYIL
jgi:hypothetical protein